MTCYLSFSNVDSECEGCARESAPGLIGWTDDLLPGRLRPICSACLAELDPRLSGIQQIADRFSAENALASRLEDLERRVRQLEAG